MNLLRNHFVVGALALIAGALLMVRIVWPAVARHRSVRAERPNAAVRGLLTTTTPHSPGQTNKLTTTDAPAPALPSADWQSIKAVVANWAEAPRRDPFRSRTDPQNQAARFLTLQAVWRQTGSNLAVINDQTLSEGDRILEFSVDQIGADRVWVIGPNGREELPFTQKEAYSSNAPPAEGQP
jgi:hypothetical protein